LFAEIPSNNLSFTEILRITKRSIMNPSFCVGSRNCGGGGERERYRRYISRDDICVLRIPGVYRFPIRTSLNSSTVGGLAYLETLGPRGLEESIALLPSTASGSGCHSGCRGHEFIALPRGVIAVSDSANAIAL